MVRNDVHLDQGATRHLDGYVDRRHVDAMPDAWSPNKCSIASAPARASTDGHCLTMGLKDYNPCDGIDLALRLRDGNPCEMADRAMAPGQVVLCICAFSASRRVVRKASPNDCM